MDGVISLIMFVVLVGGMLVCAELVRTAVARLIKLEIRRNRLRMIDLFAEGPRGKRVAVAAAGPIGGYLAISVMAFLLYRCHGIRTDSPQVIGDIVGGYPAAGVLEKGDRVLEADGEPLLGGATQLQQINERHPGQPFTVTIDRGGTRRSVQIAPKLTEAYGETRYLLGIRLEPDIVTPGLGTALGMAVAYPYRQARLIIRGFISAFGDEGEVDPAGPTRFVAEMKTVFGRGFADLVGLGMVLGVYLWFVMILIDLVRTSIVFFRNRPSKLVPHARLIE